MLAQKWGCLQWLREDPEAESMKICRSPEAGHRQHEFKACLELSKASAAEIRGKPGGCDSEPKFLLVRKKCKNATDFSRPQDPSLKLDVVCVSSFREKRKN